MDIPVKKIVRLLGDDQAPELRASALHVLAELGLKDGEILAAMAAKLDDPDGIVREAAIVASGKLKQSKSLPTLLARIKHGGTEGGLAAEAAALLGAEGVKGLQSILHSVPPGVRKTVAAALTGAVATNPDAAIAVLTDKEPQVAAAAANALIGRIPTMTEAQKKALGDALVAAATNKKAKLLGPAEFTVVRVLSSLNDPNTAEVLWARTQPPYPVELRAQALQAVGGWLDNPTKEQWRRLFACATEANFAIAAPALALLGRMKVSDKQLPEWVGLLHAPDMAARRLGIEKIGDRDTAEVAEGLIEQLKHPDRVLQELAQARLGQLDQGRKALVRALLNAESMEDLWRLARIIAPFAKTLTPAIRSEIVAHLSTEIEAESHRGDPLLFLLKEADPAALRDDLFEKAVAKRKKKAYPAAVLYLKWLARDPAIGFPIRLELAMCGLKVSSHDVSHDSRANDACLRHFSNCIAQDAAEVQAQVEKAKWLEPEDLFYLGFHFTEQFGAEKGFGAAVLQHLVKGSPKSKVAASAKNKLKTVVL